MCGINGILCLAHAPAHVDRAELLRTRDAMARRGPDAAGLWLAPDAQLGLGHRRLAIIDLSPDGVQPMSYAQERYQIVFNGEIYNYRALRAELQQAGFAFQSCSDTEVILALYMRDGLAMLGKLRGMFAFALWDAAEQRLLLARDRYGIKPLYYSVEGGYLRFASQVKALEAAGALCRELDPAALVGFLLWGSVPEPYTLRRAIRALPAGRYLLVEAGRVGSPQAYTIQTPDAVASPSAALAASVQAHLVADVPVAIFLSAGLDSSLIAALACRYLPDPPTTLTLRFQQFLGTSYDEGPLAAQFAQHLGTRHIEQMVSPADFPNLWHDVIMVMDQPSIDGFNTYLVSAMAQQAGFKVVLSGLGGDELLGGYPSFRDVPHWTWWAKRLAMLPGLTAQWPAIAARLRPEQPKLRGMLRYAHQIPGAYFLRRGLFLPEELPTLLDPELVAEGLSAYDPVMAMEHLLVAEECPVTAAWQQVQALETHQYMRNQLLRDADWASMAHSLELRVPFVDTQLAQHLAVPQFAAKRNQGKAALLQQLAPILPATLWQRPKTGFAIPVKAWLEQQQPGTTHPRWGHDSRQLALRILQAFI